MGHLESVLSSDIIASATKTGNELVIPLPYVLNALNTATAELIAVLGVEAFRILEDGVQVQTYSGYQIPDADWKAFVAANNQAAAEFIQANPFGPGFGYILTSTSKQEFEALSKSISARKA